MTKREAGDAIQAAMRERGLTFGALAEQLGRPRVWVAAAVLGPHPFSREEAEQLARTLDLPAEAVPALLFIVGDTGCLAETIGYMDANGATCLPPSVEAALARTGAVSSAFLTTPDEFWAQLEARLDRLEPQQIDAFAGMDKSEVTECIARSNITSVLSTTGC